MRPEELNSIKKQFNKKIDASTSNSIAEIRALFPISIIASEAQLDRTSDFYDMLATEVLPKLSGKEKSELTKYISLLGHLIEEYESDRYSVDTAQITPAQLLRSLMEEHQLKQVDVGKIIGSQGLVSSILNDGSISKNVAKKLGKHFRLDPKVFLKL